MDQYDEGSVIQAENEVEAIRSAALEKVRKLHPEINHVIDRRTIDDYCYKSWEYPGKWYYSGFTLPKGFHSKEELIDDIAAETIRYFMKKK
ncbi:MAG: hypothetical protein J6P53_02220 [Mailhella sp.]|nr:hypothetical protein [Mailhella sp.]